VSVLHRTDAHQDSCYPIYQFDFLTITTPVIERESNFFLSSCRLLRFAKGRLSMTTPSKSITNLILASLPESDYQRLSANLEPVTLYLGQTLYRTDEQISHVYFPAKSIISLIQTTQNGQSVEVGLVGREGMAGIFLISGLTQSPYHAIVQGANGALRMEANAFKEEFNRGGTLHDLILRYQHGLMMQVANTAVCNRLHPVEQRLARWLLMTQDRLQANELHLTHEFIATMLGSGRVPVTLAAGMLQKAGLIHYSRGDITIDNRDALALVACECYERSKAEYDKVGLEL
jgi:CRP-like cAMP-binding protein